MIHPAVSTSLVIRAGAYQFMMNDRTDSSEVETTTFSLMAELALMIDDWWTSFELHLPRWKEDNNGDSP